jgi:hypothetical protein
MPSLTVTEKEHWKERIARKIDQKIEAIAAADPGLLERISGQARQHALRSLGLADMQAELDAVTAQRKELDQWERQARQAMLAVLRRVPVEEVADPYYGCGHPHVTAAVQKRQAVHEEELLAGDERGREILRLRREKDNLLDTVWLATSPQQVKELWKKVVELLGGEQTALQREALTIGSNGTSA